MLCVVSLAPPSLKSYHDFGVELWCAFVLEPLSLSLVCVCVFVSKKKKKRMGNCPTLLKRVCCVLYNLPHPPLKVTMTFEWSCGVPLC